MLDLCIVIVFSVVAVIFYVQTLSFPQISGFEKYGASFWPQLTLIGIVICSISIAIEAIVNQKKGAQSKVKPLVQNKENTVSLIVIALTLFSFTLFTQYIGFWPSAFLNLMVAMYALGERRKSVIFFFSFCLVVATFIIFAKIMLVRMPRGISIFRELSYTLY